MISDIRRFEIVASLTIHSLKIKGDVIELWGNCTLFEPVGPISRLQRGLYPGARRWRTPEPFRENPLPALVWATDARWR